MTTRQDHTALESWERSLTGTLVTLSAGGYLHRKSKQIKVTFALVNIHHRAVRSFSLSY